MAREGLAAQLALSFAEIRCAWDLPSLITELGDGTPRLILLNKGASDSAAMLDVACDLAPRPKVVVFGLSHDDVIPCARAGASGLHLRSESFEQLLTLIRNVEDGLGSCSPEVTAILMSRIHSDATTSEPRSGSLTARETEILRLVEEGLTNKQIATRLYVSVHTVKNHIHNLLAKLGAQSRAEATYKHSLAMRSAS
jgi:DNA-binding NarL/FixJ family response regulator